MRINTKSIGKICLITLGAFIIWLGARALMDIPEYRQAFGSAVALESPVILPENEGKMVILHGKVEMTKPAYDDELGLTLDTLHAFRYDEEYALMQNDKKESEYKWVTRGTKTIVGEAKIGEFELDEKTLMYFPTESYYSDFDSEEVRRYGTSKSMDLMRTYVLVDASNYYQESSGRYGRERVGDKASYYRYYDPFKHEATITVAGIQQGSKLVAHDKVGAIVREGALSPEELANKTSGSVMGGGILFIAIGILLILLGVRKQKSPKNSKRKNGKTKAL